MTRETSAAPRLRLVLPCYNEAARLEPGVFLDFVASRPDVSLLFVDDGSTDATAGILADMAARSCGRIEVLALPENGGKARAVQQGMRRALAQRPEFAGYWDSDLSTPLDMVPGFLALLEADPRLDLVIGSRVKLLGRDIRRRAVRHYVGRVFATAASVVLDLPVYDTQCGAKIFRASDRVARIFAAPFSSTWIFDVEMLARYACLARADKVEARVRELPLEAWHDVPGSKVRLWHGLRAAWDLLRVRRSVRAWQAAER